MKRCFLVWAVLLVTAVAWAQGDQGDGKYKNPVLFADIPDPDVIRVGDTYVARCHYREVERYGELGILCKSARRPL